MTAPSREDLDRALARARENLRLGDEAADQAVRHDKYVQAAQALSSAGRLTAGLAAAIAPPETGGWGVAVNYAGAQSARSVMSGPGPR